MTKTELEEMAVRDPERFNREYRRLREEKVDFLPVLGNGPGQRIEDVFAAGLNDRKGAARQAIITASETIMKVCEDLTGAEEAAGQIRRQAETITALIKGDAFK